MSWVRAGQHRLLSIGGQTDLLTSSTSVMHCPQLPPIWNETPWAQDTQLVYWDALLRTFQFTPFKWTGRIELKWPIAEFFHWVWRMFQFWWNIFSVLEVYEDEKYLILDVLMFICRATWIELYFWTLALTFLFSSVGLIKIVLGYCSLEHCCSSKVTIDRWNSLPRAKFLFGLAGFPKSTFSLVRLVPVAESPIYGFRLLILFVNFYLCQTVGPNFPHLLTSVLNRTRRVRQ